MLCLYIFWRWNTKDYCFYCQNMYLSKHELTGLSASALAPYFFPSQLQRSHFKPGCVTPLWKTLQCVPYHSKKSKFLTRLWSGSPVAFSNLFSPAPHTQPVAPAILWPDSSPNPPIIFFLSPLSEKKVRIFSYRFKNVHLIR